jgi:hypothetical protein
LTAALWFRLGTWVVNKPTFLNSIPDDEQKVLYTKIILNVSSQTITWRYSNSDFSVLDQNPALGKIKWVRNSINSDDGTQQQHYAVEFAAGLLGESVSYMNIRAKDKVTGRQMNVYIDNGPNAGDFPANVYSSLEDASTDAARRKQRDAIVFQPMKLGQ